MKNKETSIEWFVSQLPLRIQNSHATEIEKAKEMNKEEIKDAYDSGWVGSYSEDYYNETYKQPNNE
jgi:hypothetical protein